MDNLFDSEILRVTQNMNPDTIKDFICLMFDGYQQRKRTGNLYNSGKNVPAFLIKTYYFYFSDKLELNDIYTKFKRKYILNENKLEDVHDRKERLGLGEVYDFINKFDDKHWINLYIILKIHQLLYSKVDFPEVGGNFRNCNCFISSSDVDTTPYDQISQELGNLYPCFEELLKKAQNVKMNKQSSDLIGYINDVIELKCKLIKIHPFRDGNGRTMRAMVNLLFKKVDLPPVYVLAREKDEYIKAMDAAIRLNNYDLIQGFYYYKICDSIVELGFEKDLEETKTISK